MKVYRLQRLDGLGGVLVVTLVVIGAGSVVNAILQFLSWRDRTFIVPTDRPDAAFPQADEGVALAVSLLLSLAWIGAIIVWCIWQHHATANLWARGFGYLQVRPGWAVGWWFIPVADLFMPFISMRELARRSNATGDDRHAGPLVAWWWATFLASTIVPIVASIAVVSDIDTRMRAAAGVRESIDLTDVARNLSAWGLAFGMLTMAAAVLAAIVVRRITHGQDEVIRGPMPPRPDIDLPWLPAKPG